ncbi:TPX2-like protein, partial [Drosera capensis]
MGMDEEMVECEVLPMFEAVEVDFEYEFEAVRFFDFCRRETEDELMEAEAWFESAPSYPPSPFVAKMFLREDVMSTNVNTSLKFRGVEKEMIDVENNGVQIAGEEMEGVHEGGFFPFPNYIEGNVKVYQLTRNTLTSSRSGMIQTILKDVRDSDVHNTQCLRQALSKASCKGLSLCSAVGMGSTRSRSNAKPPFQKKSTLMKPTVSQLAKKSLGSQQINIRLMMLPDKENGSSSTHCGAEIQASKRQKLDGGFFQKVGEIKQPSDLVHKLPRKVRLKLIQDLTVSGMGAQSKLKPTVPREPELKTALRGDIESKASKETENAATAAFRFKARPLNRKILEGPSLPIPKRSTPTLPEFHVFHLKTVERAMQHAATMSSCHFQNDKGLGRTTFPNSKNGRKDGQRSESAEATNKGDRGGANKPLDKNVFATKGDLGAFKNMKRDITEPKGFQFQTKKRNQQNPPVELFSKLSLASDALPNSTTTNIPPARLQSKMQISSIATDPRMNCSPVSQRYASTKCLSSVRQLAYLSLQYQIHARPMKCLSFVKVQGVQTAAGAALRTNSNIVVCYVHEIQFPWQENDKTSLAPELTMAKLPSSMTTFCKTTLKVQGDVVGSR